jgi:glutathione S-transferase
MKLYLSPGACSLADHIALNEAGMAFQIVKVDLKTGRTDDGRDYRRINPKGYVPALEFEDGEILTENVAILSWVSELGRSPAEESLGERLARFRLLEMLAFISTEVHKTFKPFFSPDADDKARAAAADQIGKRLQLIAGRFKGDFLFGAAPTVADDYLFVMLTWATKNRLPLPGGLDGFVRRMAARPAVRRAFAEEGLPDAAAA